MEASLAYWVAGDVELILSTLSDDVVYQLYVSQTALPYGGEWVGKDAVRNVFFDMFAVFDCTEFEPTLLEVRDGIARCQCQYVYRHRASGEWLSGSCRLVCTIAHNLIVRMDEYHDEALLKAFSRFATQRARDGSGPKSSTPWK